MFNLKKTSFTLIFAAIAAGLINAALFVPVTSSAMPATTGPGSNSPGQTGGAPALVDQTCPQGQTGVFPNCIDPSETQTQSASNSSSSTQNLTQSAPITALLDPQGLPSAEEDPGEESDALATCTSPRGCDIQISGRTGASGKSGDGGEGGASGDVKGANGIGGEGGGDGDGGTIRSGDGGEGGEGGRSGSSGRF